MFEALTETVTRRVDFVRNHPLVGRIQRAGSIFSMTSSQTEREAEAEPVITLAQLVNFTPDRLRRTAELLDCDPGYRHIQDRLSGSVPLRPDEWNRLLEARAMRLHTILTESEDFS
jgi:hypothetical protein